MPPPGGGKRKRGDRSYSGDSYSRPSPHRPENLSLAQNQFQNGRDDRNIRGGRSNRGRSTNASPVNTNFITTIPKPEPKVEATQVYKYTYLTDEICELWDTKREDLKIRAMESTELEITIISQEILQSTIEGRLNADDCGTFVKELIEKRDLQYTILDLISVLFENNPNLRIDRLLDFVIATKIPSNILRYELDAILLEKLDLIRNTFNRMGIRKQTNLLYRQANFNLMREESEGFAKLITELFTTSGNEPPSGKVVDEIIEKVKAMIGAFDLDVGRSLDVVLDVFGSVLVKQFRFFVKFLRSSPWWPREDDSNGLPKWAKPGYPGWRLIDEEQQEFNETKRERDQNFWVKAKAKGIEAFTDQIRTSGNRDAAQLLGFKLRFYSSSSARDENDVLPDNLIYLSALMIKIGFISLKDLYPHIWRSDEEMEELRKMKLKEKSEKENSTKGGIRNALLSAGALTDDTMPTSTKPREIQTNSTPKPMELDIKVEPLDQKVLLLKSLLAIGALPEALFILGKFPWIIDLYPELPEYIHRICHHCLSFIYQQLQPLQNRSSIKDQKPFVEIIPKNQIKLIDLPEKKGLRWALLDKTDSSDGTDYHFYWDEWNDNIPICQNVDDVFTLSKTILPLVGVKIGQDPLLLSKIVRIGKYSLQQDKSDFNRSRWLDLSKTTLLPCLSLTRSNAGIVNEVFELINQFSTKTRYLLYLEWSTGRISRLPDIKSAFDQAKSETKDILKRISKTNTKQMARSLAKIAYANPHIVITTALKQIEVYDSIADVFVEGARYFTDLSYDVLTWAMINSMAQVGRSRTQIDGIFTSHWLSALSQFAGKIYRRYSMMKPGPILQYVSQQLDLKNTTDLKMLEQIIVSMGGISTDISFNDSQLQAMGGGSLLQSQTILQLLDKRHDSKLTSKRLIKSLQDTGLTGKFLISMSQQKQSCVFENDIPLKAIGNTFDEIQRIMVQYFDLLKTNLSTEEFSTSIPNIIELLNDYGLQPDIAFWICRSFISKQIEQIKQNSDIEMSDSDEIIIDEEAAANSPPTTEIDQIIVWNPILKEIMDSIESGLPQDVIDIIGVGFYVTFWQLSLYDITIPGKSYEDELSRQNKKISTISSDRTDVSLSGTRKKEAEKKIISELIDQLLSENKQHLKSFARSKLRLQKERDQWFVGKARINEQLNVSLMEYCFLPRILYSPLDSYFCFKFMKFLHTSGTPNFRTLGFYDLFFKSPRLTSMIFQCTSKESDNLGRFLNEILKDLTRWHSLELTYEKEAWGSKKNLPGFAMKVEGGKVISLLDFESFRKILYKWHGNLYSALIKCLTSLEYMHIRNAISILRSISTIYPTINWHGTGLQKSVDKLKDSDKEDLKVSSQALLGTLTRREKSWVLPQSFRQGQEDKFEDEIPKVEIKSEPKIEKVSKSETKEVKSSKEIRPRPEPRPRPESRSESRPESRTNSRQSLPRQDHPRPNSRPRQEPLRQEPLRQEPLRQEPLRQETLRQEPSRQEPSRQEPSRQEPSRQEPLRQEPSRPPRSEPIPRPDSRSRQEHVLPRRLSPPRSLPNRVESTVPHRSVDRSKDIRPYRQDYDQNRRDYDQRYGSRPEKLPPRPIPKENRPEPKPEVPINPERAALINGPIEKTSKETDVPSGPKKPRIKTDRPTPTGPRHTRQNSSTDTIHPSRLNQIESEKPSTPTGPKGNAPLNAPSGPSPTTRGPPETSRGRNRHPLTAVNNTLAQAGQGTSIRGRGGRQNTNFPPREGFPDLFAHSQDQRREQRSNDDSTRYRSTREDPRKHSRQTEESFGRGGTRTDKRPRRGT